MSPTPTTTKLPKLEPVDDGIQSEADAERDRRERAERRRRRRRRDDDDDHDDEPREQDIGQDAGMPCTRMLLPVGRSGWAIAAGYLGLLSLFKCIPAAPFAILTAVVAILDIRKNPKKHGMGRAVFGIVGPVLGIVAFIVLMIVFSAQILQAMTILTRSASKDAGTGDSTRSCVAFEKPFEITVPDAAAADGSRRRSSDPRTSNGTLARVWRTRCP